MKGVQEKESIMDVRARQKYPPLAITVWHHEDARQRSSGRFFLSTPSHQ